MAVVNEVKCSERRTTLIELKNICSSSFGKSYKRECQVCRVLESLIIRNKKNLSSEIYMCIADYNEAQHCKLSKLIEYVCSHNFSQESCPDLLLIKGRRCCIVELKINVREFKRFEDYVEIARSQLDSSCANQLAEKYCCNRTRQVICFSNKVVKRIQRRPKDESVRHLKIVGDDKLLDECFPLVIR
jgi:hypothetical protein